MGERWRRDGERDKRGKLIEWNGMEAKVGMEGRGEGTARVINSETEKKKEEERRGGVFPLLIHNLSTLLHLKRENNQQRLESGL